jgi:hypothetical protein
MKHHRPTNVTGRILIANSPSGGAYRSKLERDAFMTWFLDSRVKQVMLQAPVLRYRATDGKLRRYTGDLLITFLDALRLPPLVIEMKYRRKLADDPTLSAKHDAVKTSFLAQGHDFAVQTEADIYHPGFDTKKFLFEHRNHPPHLADPEILAAIRRAPGISLCDLIASLRINRIAQLELIPAVWRLVTLHKISVDFQTLPNLTTKLTLASV